jgi:formylglycine-generating enzyme required for sulfatase activity
VVNVTWFGAVNFCNELSKRENLRLCYQKKFWRRGWICNWQADGYRLPTEAEWEYACRAETTTRYSFGDDLDQLDQYAWYQENSRNHLQTVATREPNPWGLCDMHGNVWEWCWDWYGRYPAQQVTDPRGPEDGRYNRVVRGGSFGDQAVNLRSAIRLVGPPVYRLSYTGFRCVRVPS